MKKLAAFLVLALLVLVVPAGAQVSDETVLTYEVLTEDYDGLVKEAMNLTDESAAKSKKHFGAETCLH